MSILSGVSLTEIFLEIWVSYQELQSALTATAIMLRIDIAKNKKKGIGIYAQFQTIYFSTQICFPVLFRRWLYKNLVLIPYKLDKQVKEVCFWGLK